MNFIDILKKDHKKVASLFKEIEKSDDAKQKREIFKQIKEELTIHTTVEEKFLYPVLKEVDKTHDLTLESYEEHNIVKRLLKEIDNMPVNDEWQAKVTVLQENVEHHVEEEEDELFPNSKKVLTKEQIDDITEKIVSAKEKMTPVAKTK